MSTSCCVVSMRETADDRSVLQGTGRWPISPRSLLLPTSSLRLTVSSLYCCESLCSTSLFHDFHDFLCFSLSLSLSHSVAEEEPMSPRVAPGVMRSAELLRRAPFVFPFEERVRVCLPQSLPSSPSLSLSGLFTNLPCISALV